MGFTRLGTTKTNKTVFTSTSDPTVNDDLLVSGGLRGHAVGDIWVNTESGDTFSCSSASSGAAVWNRLGGGSDTKKVVAVIDATGGADTGQIGTDVFIPAGALIISAQYRVLATFTSATDAATIALSVESDTPVGLVSAVAISNGANPWDAGSLVAASIGTPDTAGELTATVAVEDLTAGKLIIVVEYVTI